jgi:hypothetical protein
MRTSDFLFRVREMEKAPAVEFRKRPSFSDLIVPGGFQDFAAQSR